MEVSAGGPLCAWVSAGGALLGQFLTWEVFGRETVDGRRSLVPGRKQLIERGEPADQLT